MRIIVEDEINIRLEGLTPTQEKLIDKKTQITDPNAFHTSAYRLGIWDGKESVFDDDMRTSIYMIDALETLLPEVGVSLNDVELVDQRKEYDFSSIDFVHKDSFGYTGKELRYVQVDAVNEVIKHKMGFIEGGTASGKTLMSVAISAVFDEMFRSIIIVPSNKIGKQTEQAYKEFMLDIGRIHSQQTAKQRKKTWENHRHIIVTWQSLKNQTDYLHNFGVLLYDEAHVMGDVMFARLRNELRNAPVRVGFSATVPKKKYKRTKVYHHIGGDILYNVEPSELEKAGYISKAEIEMIKTCHPDFEDTDDWEWSKEFAYINKNKFRIEAIADEIKSHPSENILVLGFKEQMKRLVTHFDDAPLITGDTPEKTRDRYFVEQFENKSDGFLCATYDTVGTGISVNDITKVFLLDAGPNITRVLQSIGRGARLDSQGKHTFKVIDIYADIGWSATKHKHERVKIYRKKNYDFYESTRTIKITED